MSEIDVLAIGAHPDDVEISCGGTVLNVVRGGGSVVIVDLTAGELSTNGTVVERAREASDASRVLGLTTRENLGLPDGGLHDDDAQRAVVAAAIRRYRPRIVLAPYFEDDHPDHAAAGRLTISANFLAGVGGFVPPPAAETTAETASEAATPNDRHRAAAIFFYMMHHRFTPDLIIDVSDVYEDKIRSIECYRSQLASAGASKTNIASGDFLERLRARHRSYGDIIGAEFGEPLASQHPPGIRDIRGLSTKS